MCGDAPVCSAHFHNHAIIPNLVITKKVMILEEREVRPELHLRNKEKIFFMTASYPEDFTDGKAA